MDIDFSIERSIPKKSLFSPQCLVIIVGPNLQLLDGL